MAGLTIKVLLYIVMQVIWCLKFCNMTKSRGGQSPAPNSGGGEALVPVPPVIYAHAHTYAIV